MMSPDERTLSDLYQQMIEGWSKGSVETFAAPFAEDVEFVPFDGVRIRGRADLIHFHHALFATHLQGTTLVEAVENAKFLGDCAAVLHATGSTIMRGEKTPSKAWDSIQTLVARRSENQWEVVGCQNTCIRPIGQGLLVRLHWFIADCLRRFVPQSKPRNTSGRTVIGSPTAASV